MENFTTYPEEIAEVLCNLAEEEPTENLVKDTEEALYYIKCAAENPNNSDFFRVFYHLLEKLAENHSEEVEIPRF